MPIILMAVIALFVFMAMGLMLFYAAYKETKTEHEIARRKQAVSSQLSAHQ